MPKLGLDEQKPDISFGFRSGRGVHDALAQASRYVAEVRAIVVDLDRATPQGSPLSPVFASLLLNDLDRELESRGHCFCCDAEDCNSYVRSQAAAPATARDCGIRPTWFLLTRGPLPATTSVVNQRSSRGREE